MKTVECDMTNEKYVETLNKLIANQEQQLLLKCKIIANHEKVIENQKLVIECQNRQIGELFVLVDDINGQ